MRDGGVETAASWLLWIQDGAVGRAMRQSIFLYPAVEILHILGFALLLGTIFALDLRLLGAQRLLPVDDLAGLLLPAAVGGFAVAVATGALLFSSDASGLIGNPIFLAKLALLAAAGLNAAILHGGAWRNVDRWAMEIPRAARIAAVLSILFWVGVVVCGRLIAYV